MTIEYTTYDIAYSVLPNGDVITSDGEPRAMADEHIALAETNAAKAGRAPAFRKPTAEEAVDMAKTDAGLRRAFDQFKELHS